MREKIANDLAGIPFDNTYDIADAVLTAIEEAGYAVVPVEPTYEMIQAANPKWDLDVNWQAMIKAAAKEQSEK